MNKGIWVRALSGPMHVGLKTGPLCPTLFLRNPAVLLICTNQPAITIHPAPTESYQHHKPYRSVLHFSNILHTHTHTHTSTSYLQTGFCRCSCWKRTAGHIYHVLLARTAHTIPRDVTTEIILGNEHVLRSYLFFHVVVTLQLLPVSVF
jgi:hypothetical protein